MNLSILIPFQDNDPWRIKVFDLVVKRWERQFADAEIIIGHDDTPGPFSRARARNNAARLATRDVFCFADADTICNTLFLRTALARLETWIYPYRVYYNLNRSATVQVVKQLDREPATEFGRPEVEECEHAIPSIGGIFFLRRKDFETIGGYDEQFVGWGYEDDAFRIAADLVIGHHDSLPLSWVSHLWHEAPERVRFGQPKILDNQRLFKRYQQATSLEDLQAIRSG